MPDGGTAGVVATDEILRLLLAAIELRQRDDWPGALDCLDAALNINPGFLPLQVERGLVLAHLRRYEEALDALDCFLRQVPASAVIAAQRDEIVQQACAALDAQLHEQPADLPARLRRAGIFCRSDRYAHALRDFAAVLRVDREHVDALNGMGGVLLALDRHDEAAATYARALSLAPERAEIAYNLGNVLQQQGHFAEARVAYVRAIEQLPDFAEAHLEIAHCWLAQGSPRALADLEWRWLTQQLSGERLASGRPLWLGCAATAAPAMADAGAGGADLSGKTLLVWAEQGFGDTLQFVRFVPLVLQLTRAARVILRVQQALCRLLAGLDPRLQVIGDEEALPAHELQCPLLSLPLALGFNAQPALAFIPVLGDASAYLRADPGAVARWGAILRQKRRLRVGLAWAGRQRAPRNRTRDLPLAELLPLAGIDVELISLQKEIPLADTATLASFPRLRCLADAHASAFEDFASTAALIENLDLVISVDSAVAHLAGGLGKPCCLLLRYGSEWRWQRGRSDSPWYPSLRIFRQQRAGDWRGVVAELRVALVALLAGQSLAA